MKHCLDRPATAISGAADQQPYGETHLTVDGVYIGEMHIPRANTLVPQHAHTYAHTSLLAAGSARVWADGELLGDFVAPKSIHIAAGVKHSFLSLVDETVIYCIHNVSRSGGTVEIAEEHHIVGEG